MSANKQPQPGTLSPPRASGVETRSDSSRPASAAVRATAWLGPNLQVKGEISGNEDLHVECKVEGPVSLGGHRLTVGRGAEMTADITAREVVVYGKVDGDLRARDRIEIKSGGSVTGDLSTARIMVEDGAHLKGRIEIDRSNTQVGTDLDNLLARGKQKSD